MKAIHKIILGAAVIVSIGSCKTKENERLRVEVDSLRTELKTSLEVSQTLTEVGVLMDSIDLNRNLLNTHMVEGTTYMNYTARLNDINDYIKQTVNKIAALEEIVKKSKTSGNYYASTIKQLKADLEARSLQLTALQLEVASVRDENKKLAETVRTKDEEISQRTEVIQLNQESITSLEHRVDEITKQASLDQAEAYYNQALALETAAQRTRFAPKKKKATQKEALELYKLAATLGKTEAEPKIAQLEKNI